jgi:hypothetical protein
VITACLAEFCKIEIKDQTGKCGEKVAANLLKSCVILFWIAFVLTRPFGATFGDVLTKPNERGGLNLGTIGSSIVLASILVVFVVWSTIQEKRVLEGKPGGPIPAARKRPKAGVSGRIEQIRLGHPNESSLRSRYPREAGAREPPPPLDHGGFSHHNCNKTC